MPVSRLIVKQILQEAGPIADAGCGSYQSHSPGAWGPATPRLCPGLRLPLVAFPKSHTCGEGASGPRFQGFLTQKKQFCPIMADFPPPPPSLGQQGVEDCASLLSLWVSCDGTFSAKTDSLE